MAMLRNAVPRLPFMSLPRTLHFLLICWQAYLARSYTFNASSDFVELPETSLRDGLTVHGAGHAWLTSAAVGTVSVTGGDVLLSGLTLSQVTLISRSSSGNLSSQSHFLVPAILSVSPGVSISLIDITIRIASCAMLLEQQVLACNLLPWAAVLVSSGSLHVAGWRSGSLSLRNVTATCDPAPNFPIPTPPCIATTAGSALELAAVLQQLDFAEGQQTAVNGTLTQQHPPPPAYVTLTANISLSASSGWPSNPPRITRNITVAGSPHTPNVVSGDVPRAADRGKSCCPEDVGIAAAQPAVADGWVWPTCVGIDMVGGWNLLSVAGPYGILTFAGIALEKLAIGVPGAKIPFSLVSEQLWGIKCVRPGQIWTIDCALVPAPSEYSYWLYWMTLAASPAAEVASQAAWVTEFFPGTTSQVLTENAINFPSANGPRVNFRRCVNTNKGIIVARVDLSEGLGTILPTKKVPFTEIGGASNCRELAAALSANGSDWKPVIILTDDISLAHEACPDWPADGVKILRDTAVVGNVGRTYVVIDFGSRQGAIQIPGEETVLGFKGVALVGNGVASDGEASGRLGLMAHNLFGIFQFSPRVNVLLYNTTLEVPAEEVALVAALARQRPAPANTLLPDTLNKLRTILQPSRVAAGADDPYTVLTGNPLKVGATGYDRDFALELSELDGWGIRGADVVLTSNVSLWLMPRRRGGINPFNSSPAIMLYLDGPGATPDGLARQQPERRLPGWAIAVVVAVGLAAVAVVSGVLWVRRRKHLARSPYALTGKRFVGHGTLSGGITVIAEPAGLGTSPRAVDGSLIPSSAPSATPPAPGLSSLELTPTATGSPRGKDTAVSKAPGGDDAHHLPRDSGRRSEGSDTGQATDPDYLDSFDNPPDELDTALLIGGNIRVEEELATMVAGLRSEMRADGEELIISDILGQGAFGVVYKGVWKGLSVAVKTLRFSDRLYGNERERQAALKEAAICCSLHHPNVVSTYTYELKPVKTVMMDAESMATSAQTDVQRGAGAPAVQQTGVPSGGGLRIVEPEVREWKLFLIQEFCSGGTLRELVDRGVYKFGSSNVPLLGRVLSTALEVAAGMAHIHSKNVVHGDLNPNNVLMASPSASQKHANPLVAKIADFGLSYKLGAGQVHVSNVCCGTPPYVSPEVMSRGQLTKAADVWSMGLILWELGHGRPPWRRTRREAMAELLERMNPSVQSSTNAPPTPSATASTKSQFQSFNPLNPRQQQPAGQDSGAPHSAGACVLAVGGDNSTHGGVPQASGSNAAAGAQALAPRAPVIDPSDLTWSSNLPSEYVQLGQACLSADPLHRPSMPQMVRLLIGMEKQVSAHPLV